MNPALLPASSGLGPDLSICDVCLQEVRDPGNRRHRYPFTHCRDCGPRFTISLGAKGAREHTTLASFPPCPACRAEREDPTDRRFGSEGVSCPDCGPGLIFASEGERLVGDAALLAAAAAISKGRIVALKGTGGYLLAADAQNEEAVQLLRKRKHRPHKPFAVMARDMDWLGRAGVLGRHDPELVQAPERPILLLPRRSKEIAEGIAPHLSDLGLFLPSTALQALLLAEGPPWQVMTSANLSGEPIAIDDASALQMLGGLADGVLFHRREIRNSADDSVFRSSSAGAIPIRRSRGFVPRSLPLPYSETSILAVGGQEKSTICLGWRGRGIPSQHLGDLDQPLAWQRFQEATERFRHLLGARPSVVAHDLHPDYRSTRWAIESGLRCVPVQHHHAHIAACLVENHDLRGSGRDDGEKERAPPAFLLKPVIGIAFDGTGLGDDGTLWGGEILLADLGGYERLGHLRPISLPGGAAAIRSPWRLGVAALLDAGLPVDLLPGVPPDEVRKVAGLFDRELDLPRSTGAGRWFDAVAAICGVRQEASYDGQAASEFESISAPGPADSYPFEVSGGEGPFTVDLRQTIRELVGDLGRGLDVPGAAARFHETMANIILHSSRLAREQTGVTTVAFGGGCFQNRYLLERSVHLLADDHFEVLLPREVPQNDGGLSLGQAAVATFRLSQTSTASFEE